MKTPSFKKYSVQDYNLRFVKEAIIAYRQDEGYLAQLLVQLPVEAETSLQYLSEHYATVDFELSSDLRFRELAVGPAKVGTLRKKNVV